MVQLDVVLAVKLEVEGIGTSLTRSTLMVRRGSYVAMSCHGEEIEQHRSHRLEVESVAVDEVLARWPGARRGQGMVSWWRHGDGEVEVAQRGSASVARDTGSR